MKPSAKPKDRANPAARSISAPVGLADSDPEFLASLGRRVRAAREQRGMARKMLSRTASVSERYLAALEAGEGNASVILLRRVAGALGMRLTDLLDSSEPAPEQRLIRRFLDSLPPQRLEEALRRLTLEFGQDEAVRRKRITLIGLRGAGKTTLGGALASELRRPLIELDREIEREAGISLSEVFLLYGQAGYRRIERRCLERMINSQDDIVLTVGGGIVSEPETYNLLLLNCFTVWVKAAPEEHMSRVVAQGDTRPMAGHAEAMDDLRNILTAREPLYARADAVIDTSGRTVERSFEALRQLAAAS
ncbi:MAG: anaerobic benzoate catabolism transcriptional regulator [Gammaproteobacteria bacterium]|nr:anaerobic benzoate catabolism transcriptional regulator [Gammaproteobacteria bacterium]